MLAVKLDHSWRDIADRALHLSVELAQLFQDKIWAGFLNRYVAYMYPRCAYYSKQISIFDKT